MLFLAGACAQPFELRTAIAAVGDIQDVVPAVGRLRPDQQIELRTLNAGTLETVSVKPGDAVTAGQVLARTKLPQGASAATEYSAQLRNSRALLDQADVRAREASRLFESRKALVDRGFYSSGALSVLQAQLDDAVAARVAAQAAVDASAARLIREETVQLGEAIIAPISGTVLAVNGKAGESVGPGDEAPTFILAGSSATLVLEAEVPEAEIARVAPGMTVRFTVDAHPSTRFTGRFREILPSPRTQGSFVSYVVLIDVENPRGQLRPGMTAAVEFVSSQAQQVLRIPVQALYYLPEDYQYEVPEKYRAQVRATGITDREELAAVELGTLYARGKNRIFVSRRGSWERREVKVGKQSRDFIEVTEGLRAGEEVILSEARAR